MARSLPGSGMAYRFLTGTVRADDGKTPNYKGPWYDVHVSIGKSRSQPGTPVRNKTFYFDSTTKVLVRTQYVLPDGRNVSTQFSNWQTVNGQSTPGQIVRKENGVVVLSFNASAAATGPLVNDTLFTKP